MFLCLYRQYVSSYAMACVTVLTCTVLWSFFLQGDAHAAKSWFIEENRFHMSAHGDMACIDCHEAQNNDKHPQVSNTRKIRSTAFSLETCLQCHKKIVDALDEGTHGGKTLIKHIEYTHCVTCHNPHYVGLRKEQVEKDVIDDATQAAHAVPSGVDACLTCHGQTLGKASTDVEDGPTMCLSCHGPQSNLVRMDTQGMENRTHGQMNCLNCHTQASRFPHNTQERVNCRTCHTPHDEKVIHDAHSRVMCGACHLSGVTPVHKNGIVDFRIDAGMLRVHSMDLEQGTASCTRCHNAAYAGFIGASEDILPPKSVLCMGCHAATFSVQDTPSRLGLAVFLIAFICMAIFWRTCSRLTNTSADTNPQDMLPTSHTAGHGASRIAAWATFILDVFLQRRLYIESPTRWAAHALIFFPFLFRCTWGMVALLGSLWTPEAAWPWRMLAKDWGLTAFLYDISGVALLVGLLWAAKLWHCENTHAVLPKKRDWLALCLLTSITLTGFVLEGMRIALTGMPDGSGYAFVGFVLAQFFATMPVGGLAHIYSDAWYVHAIITAVTVAYIPFSQLRHIVTIPLFLFIQTLRGKK